MYQGDKPIFKFVKELVDGQVMIIPGRQAVQAKTVQLRLVVTADSFTARYRSDGKGEFHFTRRVAPWQCHQRIQAIDMRSCTVSTSEPLHSYVMNGSGGGESPQE